MPDHNYAEARRNAFAQINQLAATKPVIYFEEKWETNERFWLYNDVPVLCANKADDIEMMTKKFASSPLGVGGLSVHFSLSWIWDWKQTRPLLYSLRIFHFPRLSSRKLAAVVALLATMKGKFIMSEILATCKMTKRASAANAVPTSRIPRE